MKHFLVILATTLLLTACGAEQTSQSSVSASKKVESEGFFYTIEAKAVNAGINPSAFAYEISGMVMTGGNRCGAKGVTAKLKEVRVGTEIHVVPVLVKKKEAPRACTREFMPQYQSTKITVRGMASQITDVIVKNVGQIGTDQNIEALLN
jgi:hypothetical protein